MKLPGRVVVPGLLAAVGGLAAAADGLTGLEWLAGALMLAAGVVLAGTWPGVADAASRAIGRWNRRVGGRPERIEGTEASSEDPRPERAGPRAMTGILARLRLLLHAERLVVWKLDPATDRAVPELSCGGEPEPQRASGSPLAWVAAEESPIRLDPRPSWAGGEVVVLPIAGGQRVLTVESRHVPDSLDAHGHAAGIVAEALGLVDREADAAAERDRVDRVVTFLMDLAQRDDPAEAADALAAAAVELTGARGALVASWDGVAGEVLGASDPGLVARSFSAGDGDLAHAARSGATIHRQPTDLRSRPPLIGDAHPADRARFRAAVPLRRADGAVGGVVGVWGPGGLAGTGIRLLEALGPLVSLQLRQASDLVDFRDRATRDALTGLPNRAAFDRQLETEKARFHRYRRPLSLLVLDLDHFKAVNDTYGHEAGDTVLCEVADILRATVRDVDAPARYGGEEMVVLMPETSVHAARDVAERIRQTVAAARIEIGGSAIPVTVSIGVSGCPERVDTPDRLFDSADQALYEAKTAGRDRVVVHGDGEEGRHLFKGG